MLDKMSLRQGKHYVWVVWTGSRWELRAIRVSESWRPVESEMPVGVTDSDTLKVIAALYCRPQEDVKLKGFERDFLLRFPLGWFVVCEENVALPRFRRVSKPRVRDNDAAVCMMRIAEMFRKGGNNES